MKGLDIRGELTARLDLLRKQRPLIHHVTNQVAAAVTADATLAVGGVPVMARSPREAPDAARRARALVINMGTPSAESVEAMLAAGRTARRLEIPVVFDPVGMGFTPYRGEIAGAVMKEAAPAIICGNRAEIVNLSGETGRMRGVEGGRVPDEALSRAGRRLALRSRAVVAATGETDWVTDGVREFTVRGGHEWMRLVSATGCTATAVTACFAAVSDDHLSAAVTALVLLSLAGERAARGCPGPGSYRAALVDQLWRLSVQMPPEEEWCGVVVQGGVGEDDGK